MGPTMQPIDFCPHMGAHRHKGSATTAQGKLLQQAAHLIRRQITIGLKEYHAKRTAVAMEKIEGQHLAAGEPKEAWWSHKGWYKADTNPAPKASKMSLATRTAEHVALYRMWSQKETPSHLCRQSRHKGRHPQSSDRELRAVVREP